MIIRVTGDSFMFQKQKNIIGSADYALDHIPPAGALFNLEYDGNIDFSFVSPSSQKDRPPHHQENDEISVNHKNGIL